jgi:acyl-CoA reductase-like NAD-dependent aldehyde dehydrogenase
METVANFIHGECVTGSGQRVQAIFNPATGEQIRQVVMSTAQETGAGDCRRAAGVSGVGASCSA